MGLLSSIGGLFKSVLGWLTPEPPQAEGGFSLEQSGTNNAIPVIYGYQKEVPVVKVLKVSSDRSGGPWNDYLHFICIVAEGEVEELGTVYFNGISENQIDDERYYIERFTGTDTQTASAELLNEFPTWKATSELNGLAYLYVRLRINSSSSWWQGEPKVTVDVKGKKVLDVRTGNVVYSQNPALCLYDFALNSRYGKGLAANKIDIERIKEEASFFETTREYERTVTNIQFNDDEDIDENSEEYINDRYWSETTEVATVSENLINCNVRLDTEKTVKENLQTLLKGMRGIMPESNGQYKLTIEKEAQATYTFTEDTIVGTVEFDGGDQNKRYNRVIIKFRNNETGQDDEVTFPEDEDLYAQYLAEDNGKDLEGEFDFPTIGQRSEALQMGHVVLERSREQGRVKITGTPETVVVEAGDIVAIPNKRFGWVNKPFRIEIMEVDNETGECGFQGVEHQNTIYPWAISSVVEKFVDTTFALPADVRVPIGLRWTEEFDNEIRQGVLSWSADRSSLVAGYSGRIYQGDTLVDSFDENTNQFAVKSLRPGDYRLELSTYNSLFYSDAAVFNFKITNIPTTSLYTWVRYADDADGTGITSNSENKAYIGFAYNKSVVTASNNKSDYTWSRIEGQQGADGIQGLQGENGEDGIPGTNGLNGADGQTSYFHIAYADTASGGGFSQNPTGKAYIGTYSDFTAADSNNASQYNWQLVQGAQGEDGSQGIPGVNGSNGQTSYLHIAYANNSAGTSGFSVSDSNRLYIGQYTDFTVSDSTNPSAYSWTLIRGSDGSNGADGSNGLNGSNGQDGAAANANLHLGLVATGAVSIDETGQIISKAGGIGSWDSQVYSTLGFNGAAVATVVVAGGSKGNWMFGIGQDPTTNASFNSIDYALFPQPSGTLGIYENGSNRGNFGTYTEDDVLSVIYDGLSVKYLKNGTVLREVALSAGRTMYFDSSFHSNNRTFTKAISFTAAGVSGKDGLQGLQGLQGEDGEDGIPGTNGLDGADGQTSYFHIAYADNASGGGFSQNPAGKAYIGTYSDFTAADSNNASQYNWQLVQGAQGEDGSQGIPGVNGSNGQTSYLHIAYANNSNGTSGFSVSSSSNKLYIGQYTDFIVNDSTNPSAYQWTQIRGADGQNGTNGTNGKDGVNGTNATQRYSWTVYSDSTSSGTIYTVNNTPRTYIGVAHNQTTVTPNTSNHALYSWYLAIETIDLSDSNILVNRLNSAHIAANAINAFHIESESISADHIEFRSITGNEIDTNTINSSHIQSRSIQTGDIDSNSITANELAANSVNASHITANSITASELAANSVNASHIAANSITAESIKAGTLTVDNLEGDVTDTVVKTLTTTTRTISNGGVVLTTGNITSVNYDRVLSSSGFNVVWRGSRDNRASLEIGLYLGSTLRALGRYRFVEFESERSGDSLGTRTETLALPALTTTISAGQGGAYSIRILNSEASGTIVLESSLTTNLFKAGGSLT